MAGLVLGLPPTALLHQPLHHYLQLPQGAATWEVMMQVKPKRSALKKAAVRGAVAASRAFTGAHPDGGTMRIEVQGSSMSDGLGSKTRIEAMLHPDVTFQVGAGVCGGVCVRAPRWGPWDRWGPGEGITGQTGWAEK